MERIWANRLEAGTKVWSQVPDGRKAAVKVILAEDVANEKITAEDYKKITGEAYTA